MTDNFGKKIEAMLVEKEKDIMTILYLKSGL
jgi:ribosome recycling factor